MSNEHDPLPTWCQKLGETTEVIVVEQDTSWKIWTTVINSGFQINDKFKIIVKQHTGSRKCAKLKFFMKHGATCNYTNFSPAEQYDIQQFTHLDNHFVISVGIDISEPYRSKPVEEWTDKDYIISVGGKKFAVDQSVSEKLKQYARGKNLHEVELKGVDYEDVITMIDNPELIKDDITVEKCRKYGEIERRYGINCLSELVAKVLETDFWSNADVLNRKLMNYRTIPSLSPDMIVSKKFRLPSLSDKFTINAFDMKFDVYFYIQEYNNTSFLSIGVITDKSTDNEPWSSANNLNIQLHHPQNPELNRSADISREFNNYQRSAGCPTFMLSSDLGDYCQRDGSYIVTITLTPTVINNDTEYPGIHDVMVTSGNQMIMVLRDLLLHYCGYFKTLPNTDKLSADIFPIEPLKMMLDVIYHRSTALTKTNIQKLLNLSETIICPYAHNYCDRLLASFYHTKLLSVKQTKELLDGYDLPLLREAAQMSDPMEPEPPSNEERLRISFQAKICSSKVYTSEFPSNARIVEPLTVKELVDIILPTKLFKSKKEQQKLCEKFYAPNGFSKLRAYQEAISTLEGVPLHLRNKLRKEYNTLIANERLQPYDGVLTPLDEFMNRIEHGGLEGLQERAEAERALVKRAMEELEVLMRREWIREDTPAIDTILARNEKDCRKGRIEAARMFVDRLRMDEVYVPRNGGNPMREWVEYFGHSTSPSFDI